MGKCPFWLLRTPKEVSRDLTVKHTNVYKEVAGILLADLSVPRNKDESILSFRSATANVDSRTQCRSSSTSTFWLWLHCTSIWATAAWLWVQHVRCSTSQFGASVFSY